MNTYSLFASQYDDAIRQGAQAAMMALLGKVKSLLPIILGFFVVGWAIKFRQGALSLERLVADGFRVALLMWLIQAGAYVPMIWTVFVDTLPNEIASAINGNGGSVTAISQFDQVDAAAAHHTAMITGQATGITQIGNLMAAWMGRLLQRIFLDMIFAVFISMRWIGYILVAGGIILLPCILFDATRGWLGEFFGKMVGLVVWQLMTSILVHVMLTGMQTFLRTANSATGMSLAESIDTSFRIAGWFFICFVLMILVPAVSSIGSHIGSAAAIVQSTFVAGATKIGGSAARGGRSIGMAAGRAYRNRRTAP